MTQIPVQQPAPNDSSHKLQVVISVEADKEGYEGDALQRLFQQYLVDNLEPPFSCVVKQVCGLGGGWYDLELFYSTNIVGIYKLLIQIPWIKDARTKPVSDFGKRTLATIR